MKEEILEELNIKEDNERECKLATGGLPESIWETYSSFANTNGGTILLGIREHRDSFTVEGLTDKQIVKYQKDFWSTLNDRNKVSKNILLNHHVRPVVVMKVTFFVPKRQFVRCLQIREMYLGMWKCWMSSD